MLIIIGIQKGGLPKALSILNLGLDKGGIVDIIRR